MFGLRSLEFQKPTSLADALLEHDTALRDIYRKLLPLLEPPPDPPSRRIHLLPLSDQPRTEATHRSAW